MIEAGEGAAFPAGTGMAHAFVDSLGEELGFLYTGERKDHDVITYPDLGSSGGNENH